MTIDEFLTKTRIKCLYHFTDVENLESIKKHGLLSYAQLKQNHIPIPKPGGNKLSQFLDQRSGLDDYVHLCLKDQHPMEYTQRMNGTLGHTVFLEISTDVLKLPEVMGCPEVANKSGARILPIEEALDKFDLEILFNRKVDFSKKAIDDCGDNQEKIDEIHNLRKRYNEAKKAEILIPNCIEKRYIFFPPDIL